jgi:hypothetical protein
MVLRSKNEVIESVKTAILAASPQLRVDVDKGPFYYLAAQGVAQPIADVSSSMERIAQLVTLQFPTVATTQEAAALARAFALALGTGGFSSGLAYVFTSRRPAGSQVFTVAQGDAFGTSSGNTSVTFEAIESRTLSASNADAFYNPATRRYELPVRVAAVSAGVAGNIPSRTLTAIRSGAADFDGVTNVTAFTGGSAAQTVQSVYERTQQRLGGLDSFSRAGLVSVVQNVDVDRIQSVSLTYSSEYPVLFYRLPDKQAVDVWLTNTTQETTVIETFVAAGGQTQYVLGRKPVLSLITVQVNGASVGATLVLDESLQLGRSTQESSYVTLNVPAVAGDLVDVTYTFDAVLDSVQQTVDGYLNADTGALFSADVLVRYKRPLPVVVSVVGTVLGTFDPTTVESEVATVVGDFLASGENSLNPADLRDAIRAQVPGIASLSIPVFCRKTVAPLVETIDIPRNSQLLVEESADVTTKFT